MNEHLKSLTRRQLIDLKSEIEKELIACALCGREGALSYSVRGYSSANNNLKASIKLCKPCIEKIREPQSLAESE